MLISLYRLFVGYLLDLILSNRFNHFMPHNQPLTATQLQSVRDKNIDYFQHVLSDLIGRSINETRVRLIDVDLIGKGLVGLMGLTAVVLFCSMAWTELTNILVLMIPAFLGMLIYTLFQGQELVKLYKEGFDEKNVQKMSVSLFLFFIAKFVLIQFLLMISVLLAAPVMLLVWVVVVSGLLSLQVFEFNRLINMILVKDISGAELALYLEKTNGLYTPSTLSHFDESLAKGLPLNITIIQRYQLFVDGSETKGEHD
ncbi:hypothetical protein [Pseudomonas serbica]|uniref:hypothetical protein n=1 Tax=Pseudomonas serbica TaxID=2965074 RepID=UPI00237BF4AB|nr:hypothetical protein [Pseudomonas serbica]